MSTLNIAFIPWLWQVRALALRVDVDRPPDGIERELEALHRRMRRRTDALHRLPELPINVPGFAFRHRVADGEHYVYVEDTRSNRLAGYTVFNRLVEVQRKADRHLRAPHSKYAVAYQRRGLASAVYRWWLDHGNCLITGARQSSGAHALWHALGRHYDLFFVDLRDKTLCYLGDAADDVAARDDLHTRMVMLGKGRSMDELARLIGMRVPQREPVA